MLEKAEKNYKRNIKEPLVPLFSDINMVEDGEHLKCTALVFLSLLLLCSPSSTVFISENRDMHGRFIFFKNSLTCFR